MQTMKYKYLIKYEFFQKDEPMKIGETVCYTCSSIMTPTIRSKWRDEIAKVNNGEIVIKSWKYIGTV